MTVTAFCPYCDCRQQIDPRDDLDLTRCQGDDGCTARMCRRCRRKCFACSLYSCESHIQHVDGDWWCDLCAAEAKAQDAEQERIANEYVTCND